MDTCVLCNTGTRVFYAIPVLGLRPRIRPSPFLGLQLSSRTPLHPTSAFGLQLSSRTPLPRPQPSVSHTTLPDLGLRQRMSVFLPLPTHCGADCRRRLYPYQCHIPKRQTAIKWPCGYYCIKHTCPCSEVLPFIICCA